MSTFLQFDVIFICETWITDPDNAAPPGFCAFNRAAFKPPRGRPAGGYLLLIRSSYAPELVSLNEGLICVKIGLCPRLTLACVYWCPSDPVGPQLSGLRDALMSDAEDRLLVIGDFNCRIGQSEDIVELLEDHNLLSFRRRSRDDKCSTRGSALRVLLDEEGLVILNGRTQSDPHGDFTFVSPVGRSLVDLVICSPAVLPDILDGGLLPLASGSDHFPVFVTVAVDMPGPRPRAVSVPVPKLRWNESLKFHFNYFLQSGFSTAEPSSLARLCEAMWDTAEKLGMRESPRSSPSHGAIQPWFSKSCLYFKRCRSASLRAMRASGFSPAATANYLFLKSNYELVKRHAKDVYYGKLSSDVLKAGDSPAFWKAIRQLLPPPVAPSPALDTGEVVRHFHRLFNASPSMAPITQLNPLPSIPQLDQDFTLLELDLVLAVCKRGKAPGVDGVSYEFYVNLDLPNRLWLLDCLNGVLRSENVPPSWSDLKMFLLFKKGDPSSVANYRGISLLNCIAKLFTSLIARRITAWATSRHLLPESQAGFRSGRSCADNLFVLQTAIHEHIRTSGNGLLCTFVDFKQAFDSVDHQVLWQKLANFGISGKMLRILTGFYSKAQVRVLHGGNSTPPIHISNGVLQGDCLSPLLFSLLVADFEAFLDAGEVDGIGIGPRWEIKCLFYADDLVLPTRNFSQMQKALNALGKFCEVNKLTVNTSKTKVVFFKTRDVPTRRIKTDLLLNGVPLELVSDYTYLGVIFSRGGKFASHEAEIRRKALLAAASVRQVLGRLTSLSHASEHRLFQAKICSIILYGAETWALWSRDEIEKIQLQYYKRLFFLHNSTPGYVIRHFFGLRPLICDVITRCLKWYNRILCMSEDRWPRRCLDRLSLNAGGPQFNWLSQTRALLSEAGVDLSLDLQSGLVNIDAITAQLSAHFAQIDVDRCSSSTYCPFYGSLVARGLHPSVPAVSLQETRVCLQILLHNGRFQSIYWRGSSAVFAPLTPCSCGTARCLDTIEHMLTSCPVHASSRRAAGLTERCSLSDVFLEAGAEACKLFISALATRRAAAAALALGGPGQSQ